MVNQVKLKSWEVQTLSDSEMKLRDKNLQTQGIQDTGTPWETWWTVVQQPITEQPIPETPEVVQTEVVPEPQGIQEAPVAPEVQPAPEPVTPTTPTEPIQPITATAPTKVEAPIQTAQEIKNEAIANETNEIALTNQKKETATAEFTNLVNSGASIEEIAKFTNANPDFRDSYNSVLRSHFKNSANTKFFSAYNGMSNENMYTAVKNGEITMFSDRYNMLSEWQRQAFEQFKAIKEAPDSVVTEKSQVFNSELPENKVDFNNIETFISKMFSSDLRTQLERARNDPRVTDLTQQLNTKASELEKFDIETIKIRKEIERDAAWSSILPWVARARISDEMASRSLERMSMVSSYNLVQGNLSSIKDDIETDLELFKYEDEQNKEKYQTLFSIYESRRWEQLASEAAESEREFEIAQTQEEREYEAKKLEFLEQNKILAAESQRNFQREMDEIDKQFTLDNKKPDRYETDRNGNVVAVFGTESQIVRDSSGEVLAVKKEKDYTDSVQYNKEVGQYVTTRTYEDGRKPDFFVSDVTWESSSNIAVFDIISKIPSTWKHPMGWLWCWEAANLYLKNAWVTDIRVWDSYASKEKYINNSYPQVWGLAVWNPNPEGKYGEYWHIGMVTGFDQKTNMVEITDWNKDWKWEKNTYSIPVSQVVNSDGGFVHLEWQESVTTDGVIPTEDIVVFNSLTPSDKRKEQSNPDYVKFLNTKQDIMDNPDSDIYDVIKYSWGGKTLSPTQNENISKFTQALNSVWEIQNTISKSDGFFKDWTWPFKWILRSNNPYDTTAQQLKAQITSLIPNLARWVYGEVWVLTEQDVALYRQTVPNLNSTEDVNNAVLWMTLRLIRNGMKENLQDLARWGFDTSLFEWKIRRIDQQVELIERDLANNSPNQDTTQPTWPWSLFNNVNQWLQISGYDEFTP